MGPLVDVSGDARADADSDEALFARVLEGETELFARIMRRHNQQLYRIVRAILRDDYEAEDALQQAYMSALTSGATFRGDAKLSTWLTRIAINEALARARKRERQNGVALVKAVTEERMSTNDGSPSPEDVVSSRELAKVLEDAIDALPDLYRTVFVLRDVEDMSTAETATFLDITEEAARVRLHRARLLMRQNVDQALGEAARQVFRFDGERCNRIVERVLSRIAAR